MTEHNDKRNDDSILQCISSTLRLKIKYIDLYLYTYARTPYKIYITAMFYDIQTKYHFV